MNFEKRHPSDDTLGLVCRLWPMHLPAPGDKRNCMKKGQVLEVFTDYDAVLEHFPDRSEEWSQEFIGMEEDEDCYKLYIGETKQRR